MKLLIIFVSVVILRNTLGCEHNSNLKYVNQECKVDSECYNANNKDSTSCKDGLCACNDGYVEQLQWFAPNDQRAVCAYAPYENQQCTTGCQKPFTCAPLDESNSDLKTCQCRPPFIVRNGICLLECGSDEVYENGECKKRCLDDENKEDGSVCKKVSQLGGKCDGKNTCWTPYSMCVSNVCVCGYGFVANSANDACVSADVWCPVGHPIRSTDNKILECKVIKKKDEPIPIKPDDSADRYIYSYPQSMHLEDDCAVGQFCMLTSGEGYYADGATGHCCAKPKLACPLGVPHPNATCGADSTVPAFRGVKSNAPYCPYGSHVCLRWSFGGSYETSLCCPKACCTHQIFIKDLNRCLPLRNYGDRCESDDQCKGHTGICNDGRCSCDKDYVVDGGIGYQYCRRVCSLDEVPVGNDRCAPKLKLGDYCDPSIYGQCPTNAFCSDKKICDCYCGYVKLSDGTCAPQPTCPPTEGSKIPISTK